MIVLLTFGIEARCWSTSASFTKQSPPSFLLCTSNALLRKGTNWCLFFHVWNCDRRTNDLIIMQIAPLSHPSKSNGLSWEQRDRPQSLAAQAPPTQPSHACKGTLAESSPRGSACLSKHGVLAHTRLSSQSLWFARRGIERVGNSTGPSTAWRKWMGDCDTPIRRGRGQWWGWLADLQRKCDCNQLPYWS